MLSSFGALPKEETEMPSPQQEAVQEVAEEIAIDQFAKIKLKTAKVLEAQKVPKADKLLQITLKVGEETRTVVSGIAAYYTPEALVGKTVILLSNLKPAKLRGIESQGMLLAAEDDSGTLRLLTVDGDINDGASIS